jgi:hypothetical protein
MPTSLDLGTLEAALRGNVGRDRWLALARVVSGRVESPRLTTPPPEAADVPLKGPAGEVPEWEAGVFDAMSIPGDGRTALLNEHLQDLDWRLQRWARVPRVCASIASSAGFLLGCLALREGLLVSSDLPLEVREMAMHAALNHAVDVIAIGLAGTAFCVSIQLRAKKAARDRALAADKLVERLESLVRSSGGARDGGGGGASPGGSSPRLA